MDVDASVRTPRNPNTNDNTSVHDGNPRRNAACVACVAATIVTLAVIGQLETEKLVLCYRTADAIARNSLGCCM